MCSIYSKYHKKKRRKGKEKKKKLCVVIGAEGVEIGRPLNPERNTISTDPWTAECETRTENPAKSSQPLGPHLL